ncbi:MAG: hypothetical protein ACJ746_01495 [Bryobacteraceae bacterium]
MLTPELVNGPPVERLVIKGGGTTRFLESSEPECIEAAGMYVVLHSGGKEILYRSSLNDLHGHAASASSPRNTPEERPLDLPA